MGYLGEPRPLRKYYTSQLEKESPPDFRVLGWITSQWPTGGGLGWTLVYTSQNISYIKTIVLSYGIASGANPMGGVVTVLKNQGTSPFGSGQVFIERMGYSVGANSYSSDNMVVEFEIPIKVERGESIFIYVQNTYGNTLGSQNNWNIFVHGFEERERVY